MSTTHYDRKSVDFRRIVGLSNRTGHMVTIIAIHDKNSCYSAISFCLHSTPILDIDIVRLRASSQPSKAMIWAKLWRNPIPPQGREPYCGLPENPTGRDDENRQSEKHPSPYRERICRFQLKELLLLRVVKPRPVRSIHRPRKLNFNFTLCYGFLAKSDIRRLR